MPLIKVERDTNGFEMSIGYLGENACQPFEMWAWSSREKLKGSDEHLAVLCSVVVPEARRPRKIISGVSECGGFGVWSARLHNGGTCLPPVGSPPPHSKSGIPSSSRAVGVMTYASVFCIVLFLVGWYPGILVIYFHSGLLMYDVLPYELCRGGPLSAFSGWLPGVTWLGDSYLSPDLTLNPIP